MSHFSYGICHTVGRHRTFRSDDTNGSTASLAQVELLVKNILEFEFEGKHRKRLAYPRDQLPGSEVVEKRIRSRVRHEAKEDKGCPKKSLLERKRLQRYESDQWINDACPSLPRNALLIYL